MKIIVNKPSKSINRYRSHPSNYTDIESFYDLLPTILDNMKLEYEIIGERDIVTDDVINLAWHNHGNRKNTWYIKSGYLPNYFYFDRTGYSGWSTLVKNYECNVDSDTANNFIKSFKFNSRMPQADHAEYISDPYILVLGQKWKDKVLQFNYFENNLIDMVTELYDTSDYTVVFRPHPLNNGEAGVNGNLQKLIAGATAIYTMNSGAGFEALFQGKRVFTTSISDYHWGATELKTTEEFQNSKNVIEDPVDISRINKFLYYCLTEYFMNINDVNSIQKKLQHTIDQAG